MIAFPVIFSSVSLMRCLGRYVGRPSAVKGCVIFVRGAGVDVGGEVMDSGSPFSVVKRGFFPCLVMFWLCCCNMILRAPFEVLDSSLNVVWRTGYMPGCVPNISLHWAGWTQSLVLILCVCSE